MNSHQNALLCMAGQPRQPRQPANITSARHATGAASDEGDMLNVRVSRNGGWWLPLMIGVSLGVGGSIALYKWKRTPPSDSSP